MTGAFRIRVGAFRLLVTLHENATWIFGAGHRSEI